MQHQFSLKTCVRNILGILALTAWIVMPASVNGQQSKTTQDPQFENGDKVALSGETAGSSRRVSSSEKKDTEAASVPAPSGSSYNWTGVYVGGHVGYGWGKADTFFDPLPTAAQFINLAPTTLKPNPRGFAGGIQGGYNWQTGHFVVGGEADVTWTDMKGTVTLTPIPQNNGTPFPGAGFLTASQNTKYFGTLRVRAGGTFSRVFLYGTAGLAYGQVVYQADSDFRPVGTEHYPANFTRTRTGWTVGAGGEVMIAKHWSWKAEYLYYDLRKQSATIDPALPLPPFQVRYTWTTQAHTFNTGINYRF